MCVYSTVRHIPTLAGKPDTPKEWAQQRLLVGIWAVDWFGPVLCSTPLCKSGCTFAEQVSQSFWNINFCNISSSVAGVYFSSPSLYFQMGSKYHWKTSAAVKIQQSVKWRHTLTQRHAMYVNAHTVTKCLKWALAEQCLFSFFPPVCDFYGC